jgi:hypothetical protein
MEYRQSHITIKKNQKNEIIILVDDYELFDFIEDYLCEERDFDFESYIGTDTHIDKSKWNEINMGTKYSVEDIIKEIKRLDTNEIERIYRLNN